MVAFVSALKRHRSTSFFSFFTPLYGVVWSIHLTLSKITLGLFLILKPFLNHSRPLPHSLNHSLVSAFLPRRRRTIATQPTSHPHSFNHSLVSASLPPRRRSSAQIAAHSLTLISASLPRPCCSSLCASSPSPSFGTLLPLICFFFVNICKLIVDDDKLLFWSVGV